MVKVKNKKNYQLSKNYFVIDNYIYKNVRGRFGWYFLKIERLKNE